MKQVLEATVAFGTAVLGYDLLTGVVGKRESSGRRLIGVGLCGGTAAGDCAMDVNVNSVPVATLFNLATGWPTKDHILPVNILVPGDSELALLVTDAAPANAMNAVLLFG